ncbi:ABC transporter permease [Clostridium tertium]|uniref:ABC transporter permease n=1 Tax=Clostridium tertium TaxID=1559 RepID=UPI0024B3A090|nr:ABC-2 family transporter protein [Clostridium tertium]MDI9216416.1 ABC-2 family transporter protein [Clostridium tertium]
MRGEIPLIKYLTYFKCSIISQIIFRFQFFIEYISQLIIVLVKIFLWEAIVISSNNAILSRGEIITYFILVSIVSQVTDISLEMATKIRMGTLSNDLIKPINPIAVEFSNVLATKIITLIKYIPVAIILIFLYKDYFILPNINFYSILLLLIGLVISFYIQIAINMLAFWMNDVSSINYILVTIFGVFSGNLIPYEFIPNFVKKVFEILPFSYYVNKPIAGIMGQLTNNQYLEYIGLGVFYIVLFTAVNYIIFKFGIKKYTSSGG